MHPRPYSPPIRFNLPAEIGKSSTEHQAGFVCLVWVKLVCWPFSFLTSQPNVSESSQPTYRKDHHGHQSSTLEGGELQC